MSVLEVPACPASAVDADERRLRARARRRAWFCPGAGWALLGRSRWASVTFCMYLVFLAALGWFIISTTPSALWVTVAVLAALVVAWTIEIAATRRAAIEPATPGWLARGFWPATALAWAASLAIPALLAREFGWTVIGEGMSPAIDIGESVLFRRRVSPHELCDGAVVLFRLPPQTRVGEPGMLLAGRLLAVPGDTIAIRKGKYVVNGETTNYLAEKNLAGAAVDVPKWPQTLKVREERYFIVQDSPRPGLDSRSVSWLHDRDLVSARLIHVSGGRLFRPVE